MTELTAVAKDSCSEALRHTCQLAVAGGRKEGTMDDDHGVSKILGMICVCLKMGYTWVYSPNGYTMLYVCWENDEPINP